MRPLPQLLPTGLLGVSAAWLPCSSNSPCLVFFVCWAIPHILGPQQPPGSSRAYPAQRGPAISPRSPGLLQEEGLRDQTWDHEGLLAPGCRSLRAPLQKETGNTCRCVKPSTFTCVFLSVFCIWMENHGFLWPLGGPPNPTGLHAGPSFPQSSLLS